LSGQKTTLHEDGLSAYITISILYDIITVKAIDFSIKHLHINRLSKFFSKNAFENVIENPTLKVSNTHE